MITNKELRIGNKIHYVTHASAKVCDVTTELINELEPHNGSGSTEMYCPILITDKWLSRMKNNENIEFFPEHIKYVHEAQNWYYEKNKTELIIEY
tara:strand:+ start:576 stop:860 length:285 start_codon:yes stop_codon:yes gene_type:complete